MVAKALGSIQEHILDKEGWNKVFILANCDLVGVAIRNGSGRSIRIQN